MANQLKGIMKVDAEEVSMMCIKNFGEVSAMKKFLAFFCGMFLIASVSFAAISPDKIALGKIFPGISVSELVAVCGQPNYKHGDDWDYGTFKVEIDDKFMGDIVESVVTRSSGISTPNGVSVGQNASVLNSTFGSADKIDHEHNGEEYEYYSTDRTKKIEFKVVNGVIAKISCKIID